MEVFIKQPHPSFYQTSNPHNIPIVNSVLSLRHLATVPAAQIGSSELATGEHVDTPNVQLEKYQSNKCLVRLYIMLEALNSSNSTQQKFTTTTTTASTLPTCAPNEVPKGPGDCVSKGFEEWFEDEALPGFRVWQLVGIILSILLTITIALCCCIRFRVPRTKQEIEADYIRKRITRNFRKELTKINNEEMDEMDLRRALDRVRTVFEAESEVRKQKDIVYEEPQAGFRARFNTMINGMRARFSNGEPSEFNGVI